MPEYRKRKDAPSNRAKRQNAREVGTGSRFTSQEHDKKRRPPGKGQNDPRTHRGRPS